MNDVDPVVPGEPTAACLVDLLALVRRTSREQDVAALAVQHVLDNLHGTSASLLLDGVVVARSGCAAPAEPDAPEVILVAEAGTGPALRLTVGCRPPHAWSASQRVLLDALAGILHLALNMRRSLAAERALLAESEAQAADNAVLLASLREQQSLLGKLTRIQRSISARRPLNDVLDSIVAGAADLLGDEIVGLRLLDPDEPAMMQLVSSLGVPDHLVELTSRTPVGKGVGGRAIVENTLVHTADYSAVDNPLPGYSSDGIHSAMAAPVRRGSQAVGSLVVATRRTDRRYSRVEQEALTSFAEHVSLALNDARALDELRLAMEQATYDSQHDSLTGLPNRALFLERLSAAGAEAGGVSVLFLDVDDFKVVNDSLGHLVGDQLLRSVGNRVLSCLRGPDTVARLGGDEFAVLLVGADQPAAVQAAERILTALHRPFDVVGRCVHVGASIGVVSVASVGVPAAELLRDADVAMYQAKSAGKNGVAVFEPAMRDRLQARTELEQDLRRALDDGAFVVHYQPVVDARTGLVVSSEALVRWEHPTRGLVQPGEFIPLAEQTGLIVPIGSLVLSEACRQTASWRREPGLATLSVSVNVSPRQLREPGLVDMVREALLRSGLPPSALVLEITESLLVEDIVQATRRLDALTSLGVRLAVDDFGTGYSSLSYLSRLPVDILKVDRSFVAGLADAAGDGRLAAAVVALAASLDLQTVAEGVETLEQAEGLMAMGCTLLQGFLFSRPIPPAALPPLVRSLARSALLPPARRVLS